MNQEIQITRQPSQPQQHQELPREDGTPVQYHTSQDRQQAQDQGREGGGAADNHHRSKLTLLPLVFLILPTTVVIAVFPAVLALQTGF